MADSRTTRSWRTVGLPMAGLRLSGQALEFGAFVVLARTLGTASFGRFAVAFLICRYAGLVADWGASVRGVRDVAASQSDESIRALVRRRTTVTAVVAPLFAVLAIVTGHGELAPLAGAIAGRGLNRDWLALGREQGLRSGVPAALQGAAVFVFVAVLVGGGDTDLAGIAVGAGYLVGLAASLGLNRLPPSPSGRGLAVDGWLLIAVLAEQVMASTDTVLLALLRDASEAGIYAAVYRIPNAFLSLIGLVTVGLVPSVTMAFRADPTRIRALRNRALRVGGLAAGAMVLAIPILVAAATLIFGNEYAAGRGPLAVLLLATAVTALAAPLHPLYLAMANDRRQAAVTAAVASTNLVLNLLVIPWAGMIGAAITTAVAQLLLFAAFLRGITQAGSQRKLR